MIAVDTNVLLRLTVLDDVRQANDAQALINSAHVSRQEVYINPVVLSEFAWTLERTFRANRQEIAEGVRQYLDSPPYRVFDADIVRQALGYFETSKADFSDCLIGAMNNDVSVEATYTFDKAASSLDVFELTPEV